MKMTTVSVHHAISEKWNLSLMMILSLKKKRNAHVSCIKLKNNNDTKHSVCEKQI